MADTEVHFNETALLQWLESVLAGTPEAFDEVRRSVTSEPGRISKAYQELLSGYTLTAEDLIQVTADLKDRPHDGLVTASDIPFLSICPHHFLPFHGTVDITYQPGEFILGLGKIPRLVQRRTRRFQIQEFLVRDLAHDFMTHVKAAGVRVSARAIHTCICSRGPNTPCVNVATYSAGTLRDPSQQFHPTMDKTDNRR